MARWSEMAARDIGDRPNLDKIGAGIKRTIPPLAHTAPGVGRPGAGYDERAMGEIDLAKKIPGLYNGPCADQPRDDVHNPDASRV